MGSNATANGVSWSYRKDHINVANISYDQLGFFYQQPSTLHMFSCLSLRQTRECKIWYIALLQDLSHLNTEIRAPIIIICTCIFFHFPILFPICERYQSSNKFLKAEFTRLLFKHLLSFKEVVGQSCYYLVFRTEGN